MWDHAFTLLFTFSEVTLVFQKSAPIQFPLLAPSRSVLPSLNLFAIVYVMPQTQATGKHPSGHSAVP